MIDSFGARLKHYRAKELLSQQELSEKSGVSRKQISDFEMNIQVNPRETTVHKLASALNISIDDLLAHEENNDDQDREDLDLAIEPHIYDRLVELAKKNKRTVNDEVTLMLEKAINTEYDLIAQLQETKKLVLEMAQELKEVKHKNEQSKNIK